MERSIQRTIGITLVSLLVSAAVASAALAQSGGDAFANYTVKLTMEVEDRKGLLAEVSAKIADINTNINNMDALTGGDPSVRLYGARAVPSADPSR